MQTRTHGEKRARLHLENQNYKTFLPLRLKTRRHARKVETVKSPLFPSYLFVRLDLAADRWRSINGTVGVVSLVMSSGRPCPAPVGVVETLLASSDKQGIVHFGGELREGQRIMVTAGPFGELLGVLERLDDDGRARILLDIMGGRELVTLPREAIFPAAR